MPALILVALAALMWSGGKSAAPTPPPMPQQTTPPPEDKTGQVIADVSNVLKAGVEFYRTYLGG